MQSWGSVGWNDQMQGRMRKGRMNLKWIAFPAVYQLIGTITLSKNYRNEKM